MKWNALSFKWNDKNQFASSAVERNFSLLAVLQLHVACGTERESTWAVFLLCCFAFSSCFFIDPRHAGTQNNLQRNDGKRKMQRGDKRRLFDNKWKQLCLWSLRLSNCRNKQTSSRTFEFKFRLSMLATRKQWFNCRVAFPIWPITSPAWCRIRHSLKLRWRNSKQSLHDSKTLFIFFNFYPRNRSRPYKPTRRINKDIKLFYLLIILVTSFQNVNKTTNGEELKSHFKSRNDFLVSRSKQSQQRSVFSYN